VYKKIARQRISETETQFQIASPRIPSWLATEHFKTFKNVEVLFFSQHLKSVRTARLLSGRDKLEMRRRLQM